MTFLIWSGLFCLSFTWLFTLDLYTLERDAWWITLLVVGVLCNTAALRGKIVFNSPDKKYALLLIPLVLCFLILPFPYHLGVILTAAGLLILFLCPLLPLISVLASGLIMSGVILTIQSPLGVLYTVFTSYSHNFFWLDGILYRLFSFFDLKVSYSQQVFYIQTIKDLYAFPTTWEKLALFPFITIGAGSIPLLFLFSQQTFKDTIKLFLTGAAYLTVRYVFMILVFLYLMTFVKYKEEVCRIDIFWDVRVTLLTFLPFIYLLTRIIPLKIKEGLQTLVYEKLSFSSHTRKGLVYFSLAFFFLGWVYGFQDPGKEKQGRVLLDEKHSGWEKSTRKMDTEWYGNESGYNFYWMAEFINHHFPLTRNFEEITPALLSRYDILIIKNPTAPFAETEIDAIREFVRNGGGLYLMSEHTNVFGNSTYINPLAEAFGFSFRYDVLFDIEHKFEQLYYPPQLLPHPVVQHLPYFCFKVSCSIQPVSSQCEPIIISRGGKAQDIYYPSGNFYPPVKDHSNMPFGAFLQMVGVKAGKGRVVGFTDSTTYSNFEAFIAGKPELLLGTLSWLNRENRWNWLTFLFLTLAVLFFAGGVRTSRREKRGSTYYLFLVILAAFSATSALFLCKIASYRSFPLPHARTPYTKVVFEQEHGNYELPLKGFTKEREKSYEVFYQWVLRVGYYPFTGKTLEEDIQDASLLIIINPDKPFSPDELDQLKSYLQNGGKLLLMDTATNQSTTVDELLAYFGMSIKRERKVLLPASYSTSWMSRTGQNSACAIEGGEGLLNSTDGHPILSKVPVGKGMIAVMTFSQLFTNPHMGGSYRVVPSTQQREIYELQFNILRGLVEGNLETYF